MKASNYLLTIVVAILTNKVCFSQSNIYTDLIMRGITIDSIDHMVAKEFNTDKMIIKEEEKYDNQLAEYSRWRAFWKDRLTTSKEYPKGSPIPYLKQLTSLTTNPVCQNNGGNSPGPNWTQLGPFEGQVFSNGIKEHAIGAVFALAALETDLNTVYIGTGSGGLWKTTNALSNNPSWVNMTDGLGMPSLGISDIIINPNNPQIIYAAASNPRHGYGLGVIKSINGGLTWNPTGYYINPVTQNSEIIKQILFSPTNPNILFLLTSTNLHYSIDAGTTWTQSNLNLLSNNSSFNNMDFDKLNSNILYIGGQQVWTLVLPTYSLNRIDNIGTIGYPTAPINYTYFGIDALVSGINNGCYIYGRKWIYKNTSDPSLSHTINNQPIIKFNSSVWTIINSNTGKNCSYFEINDLNQSIMYIGDSPSRLVEKSINGGNSFFSITNYSSISIYNGVYTHADIRAMKLLKPSVDGLNDVLLVGDDGGVLLTQSANQSPNNLVNWKNLNGSGLAITEFHGISNNEWDANIIHGGAQDNGIFTLNNGIWRRISMGDGYDCLNDPLNSETAYAEYNYPGQVKTVNSGNSWSSYSIPPYSSTCILSSCFPPYYLVEKRPHEFDINNVEYIGHRDLFKKNGFSWLAISNFTSPIGCASITDLISIAISETNTNNIYAAFSGEAWGVVPNTCLNKLFKTQNGGTSWVDISPEFSRWASISDVIVDPLNDNRIWVSFYGINSINDNLPKNRVIYSPDGGSSWQDWSVGLPLFPVNDIIYQKGTQDLIYAATDVGIFYRKAGDLNTSWKCYKGNMPVAHVKDLEISYCSGKIRAATFGRGLWEADLIEPSVFNDIVINSNSTYNTKMLIKSNIIISSGATLTITNTGYLNISPGKSIIVKQGGRLIVDGGTLTNNCGKFWKGIEVWGTYNSSNSLAQGRVTIKNNAVISNAEEALRLWKPGDYNMSGGIIIATDSKFLNNKRSVEFISYPYSYINRGSFTNCEFIIDNNYNDSNNVPFGFLTLWKVDGVSIEGCDFINNNDTYQYKFNGIYSIDASYSLTGYCDPTLPLCSVVGNKFNNLKGGINAVGPLGRIEIWDSNFESNGIGINLNQIESPKIIRNKFQIVKPASSFFGQGIILNNCSRYIIENNEFSRFNLSANGLFGIVISNSGGDLPFPIQNNSFTNLNVGTYIYGQNSVYLDCPFGLQYYCNTNSLNTYDLYIDGNVQKNQRYNTGIITSCGNKFSSGQAANFTLTNGCDISYYHNNTIPSETPTINGNINLIQTSDVNTCPSNNVIGNSLPTFSSNLKSKTELNKYISTIKDINLKLGNIEKSYIASREILNSLESINIINGLKRKEITMQSDVLKFLLIDSTLTVIEKRKYRSDIDFINQKDDDKFNLFLSYIFSGDYLTAQKLMKQYSFIDKKEKEVIIKILSILKNGKMNNSQIFDKVTIKNLNDLSKSNNGKYIVQLTDLILNKFSLIKPENKTLLAKMKELSNYKN